MEPIIWRRSVREYSDEPVLDESITDIIKAAQFAPSGRGSHAVEFIIIKDQKIKDRIFEVLPQESLRAAPVLILPFCLAGKAVLPRADLAVASSFAILQAAALGLGTVWVHIDEKQKNGVAKAVFLPPDCEMANIIPVGYPKNELPDHDEDGFDPKKIHRERF